MEQVGLAVFLLALFQDIGGDGFLIDVAHFQPRLNLMRAGHHGRGHAGQARHVHAVALVRAPGHDLAKENHVLPMLHDRDAVVLDAREAPLQLAQLVIVRGKEGLCADFLFIQQVFHHRPGDGQAVKRAGPPADLVENHQRAAGGGAQDGGGFAHFHHEGALPPGQVVRRADAGKDAVAQADVGLARGHEAADMRQERNQCHLAHIGALARHVGAGDDEHAVVAGIHGHVVGHKGRIGDGALHDGMAALHDGEYAVLVDGGLDVVVFARHLRQRQKRVRGFEHHGVLLHRADFGGNGLAHGGKERAFQRQGHLLGIEDLMLDFLKLRGHVALGSGQGLLAAVAQGHQIQIALGDLDVIAEHAVVLDAQVLDTRLLPLGRLQVQNPLLAVCGRVAVLVQLGAVARPDHASVAKQQGRVGVDGAFQQVAQGFQGRQRMRQRLNGRGLKAAKQLLDRRHRLERAQQRQAVARGEAVIADLAQKALHIRHIFQRLAHFLGRHVIVLEGLHRVKPRLDSPAVDHGVFHPAAKQPCAHGGVRAVQKPEQRPPPLPRAQAFHQLQVAPRHAVQKHGALALIDGELRQVRQGVFLRIIEIDQKRPRREVAPVALVQAKSGERGHLEMFQQRALRVFLLEIRIGQDGAADGFAKMRG